MANFNTSALTTPLQQQNQQLQKVAGLPTAQQLAGTQTGLNAMTAPAPIAATAAPKAAAAQTGTAVAPLGNQTSASSFTSGPSALQTQTATQPGQPGQPANTLQGSFRNALLGQLNQDPNNVSLSDPSLAPQARAFQDAQTRSLAQQQQQLAEQAFAGGTRNTGAYGADLGALQQQQGEAIGQFNAGLIGNEQQRRTQALLQSLGIGGNFLTAQSAQQIQSMLGKGQLNLGLLQTLLGDRQANNSLGLQAALGAAGFNRDAMVNSLGPGMT